MRRVGELEDRQLLALIGLLRLVVRLDGAATAPELAAVDALAVEIGRERFSVLLEQSARELQNDEDVHLVAIGVEDPDARALIFATLFDIAAADSILAPESSLLEWLRQQWSLKPGAGPYRG